MIDMLQKPAYQPPKPKGSFIFWEPFDDAWEQRWVRSRDPKYTGSLAGIYYYRPASSSNMVSFSITVLLIYRSCVFL